MTKRSTHNWSKPVSLLCLTIWVTACGKKSDSGGGGAPAPLSTSVTTADVNGGTAKFAYKANVAGAKFKCQTNIDGQKPGDWQDCPAEGVSFPVQAGLHYTFSVKAVGPDGTEDATPSSYSFSGGDSSSTGAPGPGPGAPPPSPGTPTPVKLTVTGEDQLLKAQAGHIHLAWDSTQTQGDKVMCGLDQQPPVDCTPGDDLNLDQLPPGKHNLAIQALNPANAVVGSEQIAFCLGTTCLAGGAPPAPVVQAFQIGSFYEWDVPPGMHVTEYATTKTYNGALSFYRISEESDPNYLGNYPCNEEFDKPIIAASPAGAPLTYCWTTPQRDFYKWLTDARIANNHIEVATDANLVTPLQHDYISINVFDKDYEYMMGRSRFEQLCLNQRGSIQQTPPMAVIGEDFWGIGAVPANFYMCTTDLVAPLGGGLPQRDPQLQNNTWSVGSFFIASAGTDLPRFECFTNDWASDAKDGQKHSYDPSWCGTFANPSLLEVTIVSKTPYPSPAEFAHAARKIFEASLIEIQPLLVAAPPLTPIPTTH